jgi:nucleoid-associated protein YgaU
MTLIPEKPYPTQKGIQIILREFGQKDAAARAARPEQFVDLSIIKDLDSSGFIDRVYKPAAVAKAAPRSEPVVVATPSKERPPVQIAVEGKTKPVASEEKAKPVAKQIPAASDKAATPTQKGSQQQYTVKAGDTLSKIAVQFYSAIGKWEKIFEANRETLKNPNYIYVGMKLVIPADG